MKSDAPVLEGFDNINATLEAMSRASCIKQLGLDPQTP